MGTDSERAGVLAGKIYRRMMAYLDENNPDVKPTDVMRWWAFWEAASKDVFDPGRFFWVSLVATVRLQDDPAQAESLLSELASWILGKTETHVEIVQLDDDDPQSSN